MTTLGTADVARFLKFVESSSSLRDPLGFWEGMLPLVGELIPGDAFCYAVIDQSEQKVVAQTAAGIAEAPSFLREAFESTVGSHPVFQHWATTGSNSASHSLGLLSRRQLRDRAVQREVYAHLGTLDSMAVGMPSAAGQLACLCIERARPFTERECLLLDLAAPHVAAARRNAEAFELLLRATARADTHVIWLDVRGAVTQASAAAEELFARWFPGPPVLKGGLPSPVASWLKEQLEAKHRDWLTEARPLEVVAGRQRLVCRMLAGPSPSSLALLVTQRPDPRGLRLRQDYGLSPREAEVLHHAALGRSAYEIAERLHISRRTVEKHLESVYNKLGVGSRSAALAKLLLQA